MSNNSTMGRSVAERVNILAELTFDMLAGRTEGSALGRTHMPVSVVPPLSSRDLTSRVVNAPELCGGAACVDGTRIPVWTLERLRQLGVNEAEILRSYPTLRAVDLVQAWQYVKDHRDEIEREIRENEEE